MLIINVIYTVYVNYPVCLLQVPESNIDLRPTEQHTCV